MGLVRPRPFASLTTTRVDHRHGLRAGNPAIPGLLWQRHGSGHSVNGFLILDKPVGVTSFSMVGVVRRLTGVRRVGHAGTLDPLASGVLPVALGYATRLIEYLDDVPKRYVGRVRFGVATDTY